MVVHHKPPMWKFDARGRKYWPSHNEWREKYHLGKMKHAYIQPPFTSPEEDRIEKEKNNR